MATERTSRAEDRLLSGMLLKQVLQVYLEKGEAVQRILRDMVHIVNAGDATTEERNAALLTIAETMLPDAQMPEGITLAQVLRAEKSIEAGRFRTHRQVKDRLASKERGKVEGMYDQALHLLVRFGGVFKAWEMESLPLPPLLKDLLQFANQLADYARSSSDALERLAQSLADVSLQVRATQLCASLGIRVEDLSPAMREVLGIECCATPLQEAPGGDGGNNDVRA